MPRNPSALSDMLNLSGRPLTVALRQWGCMPVDVVSGQTKANLVFKRVREIGARVWDANDANAVIVAIVRESGAKRVLLDQATPDPALKRALRGAGFKIRFLDDDGNLVPAKGKHEAAPALEAKV